MSGLLYKRSRDVKKDLFYQSNEDDISVYLADKEYTANIYVLKCFTITMILYLFTMVLNLLDIFIVDQKLMWSGFLPSAVIYLIVYLVTVIGKVSLSGTKVKYFILSGIVLVYTIMGVTVTYHVVLISVLPFLYATLYSSKRVMNVVYIQTVLSTIVVVYGGYYFGLCDANMVLLTADRLQNYVIGDVFQLTQVNPNPGINLALFYILPRCLIYIAYAMVCNNIYKIVSGSLEKAKLSAELAKAKEEAERANHAKTQFLARMSHEIRTPINAVLGMNEMILEESTEEEVKTYAYDIKDSSMLLLNIVNDLLDSSKIESGKMELVEENYEMASLINDLYNMCRIKAKEKQLDLQFEIDPKMPRGYYGDAKRIKQVVLNLLTNAVKYTHRGSVVMTVACNRISGGIATLSFAVKDSGIGIKPEDLNKLAEEFQRLDVQKNKNIEGTGLGLNIVRQLLKLMGSELKVESEYEKGSVFSFELSQKITNNAMLGDFRQRLQQGENVTQRIKYSAPEAKILVVDDNRMNLKVFAGLMKGSKAQLIEAISGAECLEKLKQQKFDMVFLDHMMPGMDGVETLQVIKAEKLCDDTPIIMLTANAIVGEKEKYLALGFDDFLSKPILPYVLDRMVIQNLPGSKVHLE